MSIDLKPIDLYLYQKYLLDFLPPRIIDVHTHIWLESFKHFPTAAEPNAAWADMVASENSVETLMQEYQQMLPLQQVTPVVFGYPSRNIDTDTNNLWVSKKAQEYGFPALYVSTPETTPQVLQDEVNRGGFLGLKPYLDFAPEHLTSNEITIYDFLPPTHLEIADDNHWIIMLHIPRPGRLNDPLNLAQLLEIEKKYPNLQLIIAHVGRAYCPEDLGDAMRTLRQTERMYFDFSANTCSEVISELVLAVDSKRILFGSDMPITRMRMRRICEDGKYVNLVPPNSYGNISEDSHMREVSAEEAEQLSLFLYEELMAFQRTAERLNLASSDIEDVFYNNASRLFFGHVED